MACYASIVAVLVCSGKETGRWNCSTGPLNESSSSPLLLSRYRHIAAEMDVEQVEIPSRHPRRHEVLRIVVVDRDDGVVVQEQLLGLLHQLQAGWLIDRLLGLGQHRVVVLAGIA